MLLEVLAFCLSVIYLLLTHLSQRVNSVKCPELSLCLLSLQHFTLQPLMWRPKCPVEFKMIWLFLRRFDQTLEKMCWGGRRWSRHTGGSGRPVKLVPRNVLCTWQWESVFRDPSSVALSFEKEPLCVSPLTWWAVANVRQPFEVWQRLRGGRRENALHIWMPTTWIFAACDFLFALQPLCLPAYRSSQRVINATAHRRVGRLFGLVAFTVVTLSCRVVSAGGVWLFSTSDMTQLESYTCSTL